MVLNVSYLELFTSYEIEMILYAELRRAYRKFERAFGNRALDKKSEICINFMTVMA
tara:strand:- start:11553 stop:11720 length:168 start_codon:yes stop_codon:yes gene_type:complete